MSRGYILISLSSETGIGDSLYIKGRMEVTVTNLFGDDNDGRKSRPKKTDMDLMCVLTEDDLQNVGVGERGVEGCKWSTVDSTFL